MKINSSHVLAGSLCLTLTALTPVHAARDAAAAEELMEANKCFKCHAVSKNGKGPSLKKIAPSTRASRRRGKGDQEHEPAATRSSSTNGTEKSTRSSRPATRQKLKNVAQWILSH